MIQSYIMPAPTSRVKDWHWRNSIAWLFLRAIGPSIMKLPALSKCPVSCRLSSQNTPRLSLRSKPWGRSSSTITSATLTSLYPSTMAASTSSACPYKPSSSATSTKAGSETTKMESVRSSWATNWRSRTMCSSRRCPSGCTRASSRKPDKPGMQSVSAGSIPFRTARQCTTSQLRSTRTS